MHSNTKIMILTTVLIVSGFCYLLSPILTPFLIATLLAYLGDPLVNWLTRRWHLPRTVAVTIVFIFLISLLFILIATVIPIIERQIRSFIQNLPIMMTWIETKVLPWLQAKFDLQINMLTFKNSLTTYWQQFSNVTGRVVQTVSHSSVRVILFVIDCILVPVVTFYLLRDWPKLINKTARLIPRKIYPTTRRLLRECNDVLGAFFRGQLLVMLALGIFYSTGLSIIGLNLALLIGSLIAIFSIVPYLGTIIGLAITMIATLFQFQDGIHVVYVVALFIVGHLFEGMVLTPLLIGNRIGLHPVAVIFAILAGGQLFGFFGVLLALPVASVIMVWAKFALRCYFSSHWYHR